jgi:hypothetical protein
MFMLLLLCSSSFPLLSSFCCCFSTDEVSPWAISTIVLAGFILLLGIYKLYTCYRELPKTSNGNASSKPQQDPYASIPIDVGAEEGDMHIPSAPPAVAIPISTTGIIEKSNASLAI